MGFKSMVTYGLDLRSLSRVRLSTAVTLASMTVYERTSDPRLNVDTYL